MKITVELPEETGVALAKAAKVEGKEPEVLAAELIVEEIKNGHAGNGHGSNGADSFQNEYEKLLWEATHRTPEQIAEARARAFAAARPARPLPPGKTWMDVFVGALPDDLSDEEVIAALEDVE